MTWTYSGDPSASPKDAVRFLLGDTDSTFTLTLSDSEIAFLLTSWDSDTYDAAAAGAEQLAGQFAKEVQYASDDVTFGGDDLQAHYMMLAQQIRTLKKRLGRLAAPFDGSAWCQDWSERVDKIRIGITDNRRDGANSPTGYYQNPLWDESDDGYAPSI